MAKLILILSVIICHYYDLPAIHQCLDLNHVECCITLLYSICFPNVCFLNKTVKKTEI